MTVWWRETPLSEAEARLLREVFHAHQESVWRPNASSVAVENAATGSGDYFKAMAAGLLTLGGLHGPVEQTMEFLLSGSLDVTKRVPGWGNGFHKDKPDELWVSVEGLIRRDWPKWAERLDVVTDMLRGQGKNLFPNPSAYTAVCAIVLGIPKESAGWLLVHGRLTAWSELFQQSVRRL